MTASVPVKDNPKQQGELDKAKLVIWDDAITTAHGATVAALYGTISRDEA